MRAQGASLEAIEQSYRARFERFATVAVAILGSQAEARDAVQEAFARAVRLRRSFRGDGSLDGWLWQMVVNEARSRRRRAAMRPRVETTWGEPGATGMPDEPGGAVADLVASLPERQRLVVFLRYYADLSYGQIADALGIRPGTVAATLSAAHVTLRSALETARG
jgi:DNA-directed RNA polymerase specialized sigma24 family protein